MQRKGPPSPTGAIGESLIKGPIISQRYLHNKAEINKAFIKFPLKLQRLGGSSLPR